MSPKGDTKLPQLEVVIVREGQCLCGFQGGGRFCVMALRALVTPIRINELGAEMA